MLFSKLFWIRRFLRVVICQSKCQHEYWLLWGQYYLKAGLLESLATSELCGLSAYSYNHFRIWKSINLAGPSTRNQGLARETRIVLLTLSQHVLFAPVIHLTLSMSCYVRYVKLCICKPLYGLWTHFSSFVGWLIDNHDQNLICSIFKLLLAIGSFRHVLNNLVYHLYLYLCLL